MGKIEEGFAKRFARWDISLPPAAARGERRAKIVEAGWASTSTTTPPTG